MTIISNPLMCRSTMQAYTRPLIWWSLLLACGIAMIIGHQMWLASELQAYTDAGGLGEPDNFFPRARLFAYLVEGSLVLLGTGKLIEAIVKFIAAIHRRKKAAPRKSSVLMPGRCS